MAKTISRGSLVRRGTAGLVLALSISLLIGVVAGAGEAGATRSETPRLPELALQKVASVSGADFTADSPKQPQRKPSASIAAPTWPKAMSESVVLSTPASSAMLAGKSTPGGRQVGDSPVSVAPVGTPGAAPASVRVDLLDQSASQQLGVNGVAVRVARNDGSASAGRVKLQIDYSKFRYAFGGDWASRLRLVQVTCPAPGRCVSTPVAEGSNDSKAARYTAEVTASSAMSTFALTAGASGDNGTYAATSLAASSAWSVGAQTGEFNWSYPMRVPPGTVGPKPDLAIKYSSGSVDGQVASANNQTSWLGQGQDLQAGFVERKYIACSDDMGGNANNTVKTGDLCWKSDNATLSLDGHSSDLLWDPEKKQWKLADDDGSRIQRVLVGEDVRNGGYWLLTTTDGTRYYFGFNPVADGSAKTNSVSKVTVFGNNTDEPCNATTFDTSSCQLPWRWSLDRVVDTSGNQVTYRYAQETNNYGRNNNAHVSTYDRASYLTTIEYGEREGADQGTPPAQVTFAVAERCLPSGAITCDPSQLTSANANSWPDVPFDQICTSSTTCPDKVSPTFFTRKRLTSLTTQIRSGTTTTAVDSWTFGQSYEDPGDGSGKILWLNSITHKGLVGGTVTDPSTTFDYVSLPNRVDGVLGGALAMNKLRMHIIKTDSGAQTTVNYLPAECSVNSKPSAPASNGMRCFPVWFTRDGGSAPQMNYFQKYVVSNVVDDDLVTDAPDQVTSYTYSGSPAWRYYDDAFAKPEHRTWGDWRGYNYVTVLKGSPGHQTATRYLFFRGMYGDRDGSGGTKSTSIRDTTGADYDDFDRLNGYVREQITYNGSGGAEVSGTISTPWLLQTGTGGGRAAVLLGTSYTRSRVRLSDGTYRTGGVNTTYDDYGMPTEVSDLGDVSRDDDDRCTRTTYNRNSAAWIMDTVSREETVSVSCASTPSRPSQVVSDNRTYYDQNNTTITATPTDGIPSRTEVMNGWNSGPVYEQVERTVHDTLGRVVESYDGLDRLVSKTAFTPATAGPVTGTSVTDAAQNVVTTTLQPAWGLPTTKVDVGSKRTDLTYDPTGRLTAVWLPDRSKAGGQTASSTYAYKLSNTAAQPSAITTQSLTHTGSYRPSTALFDGFLRERQAQAVAGNGVGRMITETRYDERGGKASTTAPYYNDASGPTTSLFKVVQTELPAQTVYEVDGANRVTASIFRSMAVEKWRTTTTYGGDRVAIDPPAGDTPTLTVEDVRGNTTELRQFQGASPSGTYDSTFYTYTDADQLASVKNAGGSTWSYTYDQRGRQIATSDPDKGASSTTYDKAGRVVSVVDARNQSVFFGYDDLDRKTAVRSGSATGPVLASWVYDTVAKGLLTSSTRTVGANNYKSEVTSYDALGRPTATKTTIPAVEGKLAGTYVSSTSYLPNGAIDKVTTPTVPGLPTEALQMHYSSNPLIDAPVGMGGGYGSYLADAQYSPYGEPLIYTMGDVVNAKAVSQLFTYQLGTRRPETMQVQRQGQSVADDTFTYGYDNAGNVLSIGQSYNQGTGGDRQCFTYDYLRRLTQARTTSGASCATPPSTTTLGGTYPYWRDYEYWKSGNRSKVVDHTTAGDVTQTYAYPSGASPRPHAVTGVTTSGPSGSSASTYGYDAAGNMSSRTRGGDTETLTWDVEGELASLSGAGGTNPTSFIYGADGDRLIKHDPDGATLYLGQDEVRWTKSTNTVTSTRYYQFNGATVAMRNGAQVELLLSDNHGTATVSVNRFSLAVTRRWLDPFGAPRGQYTGWQPTIRGFVGGQIDTSTNLTHLGAREYDTGLGRFISVDPLADVSNPQQLNAYAYASNNPVTASDPDGMMEMLEHYSGGTLPTSSGGNQPPPAADPPKKTSPLHKIGSFFKKASKARGDAERWLGHAAEAKARDVGEYIGTHGSDWLQDYGKEQLADYGHRFADNCMGPRSPSGQAACNLTVAEGASWFIPGLGPEAGVTAKAVLPTVGRAAARKAEAEAAEAAARNVTGKELAEVVGKNCRIGNSFLPGTMVLLADGVSKPIEKLKLGDRVLAADPVSGKTAGQTVVGTILGQGNKSLVTLTLAIESATAKNTSALTATEGHPFYLPKSRRWVHANDLRVGDELQSLRGESVRVAAVLDYDEVATVRNLTVSGFHTFFVVVNDAPVLVHNQDGIDLTNAVEWPKGDFPIGGAIDEGGPKGGVYIRRRDGAVTNYAVYDSEGTILRRVDLTGAAHRGVETPHVQEYSRNVAPNGKIYPKPTGHAYSAGPGDLPRGC
ncbi:polymorphic toxin-type HINT domain-containing protein [Kribbella italica]|uniref:RHS repeat-associated protein n=1 Tax=Kribbella italica TaxID=1540520 RepID=A0A7W9JA31_9ACTN|nr:polymorphic toxin-type HINT domain-containing protein [Kribbella italica]MBB5838386.1 RHS repeat-associated protein [Kribbella italica]